MTGENIQENVEAESARGRECIAETRLLHEHGFYNASVSRAYYAAFHFARALLFTKGLDPRSHRGVLQLLGLHFVKEGSLPKNIASRLAELATYRELSDYNASADFSAEQAAIEIEKAESFIGYCEPLLRFKD